MFGTQYHALTGFVLKWTHGYFILVFWGSVFLIKSSLRTRSHECDLIHLIGVGESSLGKYSFHKGAGRIYCILL